jgi:penicillin amidase
MKRALKIVVIVPALLLGLAACHVGLTLWRAHGHVPPWDGELRVTGLDGPVEILRDVRGIAYIDAVTRRDALFAQGFVHAQDRFWQMALTRQTMAGRLAEWMGATALDSDRLYRHLGGEQLARRLLDQFPAEERPLLQAYADGVNAWLSSPFYRRPPEMVLLHLHPEAWRAEDVFLVWRAVHMVLGSYGQEPALARVRAWAAHPAAQDMLDGFTETTVPIIASGAAGVPMQRSQPVKAQAFSNSWLLAGAHTVSGLPLLANDPQLASTLPGFWHLGQLRFAGRRLAGASIPGVPGVAVGHNGRVAWGVTNAFVDVNDIALVELDPGQPARFRRAPEQAWETLQVRTERIRVRFGRDVDQTVRETPLGPVLVREELPHMAFGDAPNVATEVHALGLDVDTSPAGLLRLAEAASVSQALASLEAYTGPPLNVSIADTAGAIAYVVAGAIPLRPEATATSVDFAPAAGRARSYLPRAANPRLVDPAGGRIVTANQRIIGDEYPHYLSDRYNAPDRALRIHELLDARERHDAAGFVAMQMDTLSPVARRIVPLLLQAAPQGPEDAALLRQLAAWDHRFEPESAGPLLFLTWGELLSRAVLDDEMGARLARTRNGFAILERALNGEHPEWCDHVGTPERVETCAELLSLTLTQARQALQVLHGPDPARWTWGRQTMREEHLGFGGLPLLDGLFSRRLPRQGGPESLFTNFVVTRDAPDFSRSVFNSSLQIVYDLSDLDGSLFMMSGGQSGHFRSPHYHGMTPPWLRGERFTIPGDAGRIQVLATTRLRTGE